MTTKLKFIIMFALALLLPGLALAGNVNPPGGTAWDLYVFGNGVVVEEILKGVVRIMGSGTVFSTLMYFLAMGGFLILAVGAGFDPGKNLMKMFGFIISVWLIVFASTDLTADVIVHDLVGSSSPSGGGAGVVPVQNVPALVALPAVLSSKIGNYMTLALETNFSSVSQEFSVSGGGQFNMMNSMIADMDKFRFTDQSLKQSYSAYITDCAVFAMARGYFTATDLLRSSDVLDTLGKANSPSITTKYYPVEGTTNAWKGKVTGGDLTEEQAGSMGVLLSCQDAYTFLTVDTNKFAEALVEATTDSWSKSGVFTPYETAFNDVIARATGAGGTATSTPAGMIKQQAILNYQSGAFRDAAIQTGNNEMIQAAAISQAETARKSGWVAGFAMFNSMMGYVYSVLQAFIFGVTPLVVLALMVPGMGKSIFTNYSQILVWLMLWMPMLAIINFVITIFGSADFNAAMGSTGITGQNKAIVSEYANNMVIAGQFLGTMVPMLTWGLVKGAMAFTEFINAGVGASLSASAGATAASGNLSMNNAAMDSTKMMSFSNTFSSAVGSQDVMASTNAGSMSMQQNLGGTGVSANSSNVKNDTALQNTAKSALTFNDSVTKAMQAMKNEQMTETQIRDLAASQGSSTAMGVAANKVVSQMDKAGQQDAAGSSEGSTKTANSSESSSTGKSSSAAVTTNAGASLGIKLGGAGVQAGAAVNTANTSKEERAAGSTLTDQATGGKTASTQLSAGNEMSAGETLSTDKRAQSSKDSTQRVGSSNQSSVTASLQQSIASNEALSRSLERAVSLSQSVGFSQAVDTRMLSRMQDAAQRVHSGLESSESLTQRIGQINADLQSISSNAATDREAFSNGVSTQISQSAIQGPEVTHSATSLSADLDKADAAFTDKLASNNAAVATQTTELKGNRREKVDQAVNADAKVSGPIASTSLEDYAGNTPVKRADAVGHEQRVDAAMDGGSMRQKTPPKEEQ